MNNEISRYDAQVEPPYGHLPPSAIEWLPRIAAQQDSFEKSAATFARIAHTMQLAERKAAHDAPTDTQEEKDATAAPGRDEESA